MLLLKYRVIPFSIGLVLTLSDRASNGRCTGLYYNTLSPPAGHYNSFGNRERVDFIYGHPNCISVKVAWIKAMIHVQ